MPTPPDTDAVRRLTEQIGRGRVLVVTGAGISTDSGIPDYRGPTGKLRNALPMTYQRFAGSDRERQRYWARSHLGWHHIQRAQPNASHHAVARLCHAGLLTGTVTQNVDGLHTQAGSRDVIDLHGRLDVVVCIDCGDRRPRIEMGMRLDAVNRGFTEAINDGEVGVRPDGDVLLPDEAVASFRVVACRRCDGVLKPDVVFFGEHVPRDRFARALGLLDASATLLVLGSSLKVGSGFRFVTAAKRRGATVAIVNRGVTRGDRHADLRVDAGLAEVLVPLVETVAPDAIVASVVHARPPRRVPGHGSPVVTERPG